MKDEAGGHGHPPARSNLVSMSSMNGGHIKHSGTFPLLLGGLVLNAGLNVVLCSVLECFLRLDGFLRALACLLYDIAWNFMK